MNRTRIIFENKMPKKVVKKAEKKKKGFVKKFSDDRNQYYPLKAVENKTIGKNLGVKNLVIDQERKRKINEKTQKRIGEENNKLEYNTEQNKIANNTKQNNKVEGINSENGIIIGNIRMGFGHYRISMAIASAAHSMGYTPYWLDMNSFQETTGGKIIAAQNSLYSMGSRISQKSKLFNKYIWEPINYEGFRKISYNAGDQKVSELMTTILKDIPKDIPYVATHVWPSQAAIHAGMRRVVNVIPDNWPMSLHLSEGAIHTVQTSSSYFGYRLLNGMNGNKVLHPMKSKDIVYTGHYIDHELVSNIEVDCAKRKERVTKKEPIRFLLTIGGAGAQKEIFAEIIKYLLPYIQDKKVALYINVGDYFNVWEQLIKEIPILHKITKTHFNEWEKTSDFAMNALEDRVEYVHAFYHEDIFEAVYITNLLMRSADVLITKPSELAFYPVPKIFIKRVGGHEKWGAIHSAELGDGTLECEDIPHTLQMLQLILEDDSMIPMLCDNILKANQIGVYNGAYKVVELAVGKCKE